MKLTNKELEEIYFGAYRFEEQEGYLQAFQYTKEQEAYFEQAFEFWYERCNASTAKTLEFTTSATEVSFEYRFIWYGSQDTVELFVNGLASQIYYVKDLEKEGKLTFSMPEGEKEVTIYLAADATMLLRDFEINAEYTPAKKKEKVLWLGDSITQGYGPLRSAHTYVSVANRLLGYDIINQGIGGYIYDKKVLRKMEGYMPEKIIVALGTNQYRDENAVKSVEEYYETLVGIYGDTPILCITPIWRGDAPDAEEVLGNYGKAIRKVCEKYPNIKVIDGYTLVPHLSEYYLDNLHPNVLGAEIYGRNLVLAIEKMGF